MHEYCGNIHMHTVLSDGRGTHRQILAAAAEAELDFIIVTDHNVWVGGLEGYFTTARGRVMRLIGEEVHDVRRQPQANHCLVLGADKPAAPYAASPQKLIDTVRAAGGYTFLAHPYDRAVPLIGERDYAWYDWEISGFTGLELWNYMSSFKEVGLRPWQLLPALFRPDRFISGPDTQTLARWDDLLRQKRRVAVVGGSDAHGFIRRLGPIQLVLFPYEKLFRSVNTHILLDEPLCGEFEVDKPAVLQAIGRGRSWVGYDWFHPTAGFRFSAQAENRGTMGDTVIFHERATLQVVVPRKARIEIVFEGEPIANEKQVVSAMVEVDRPGAYRVVCHLPVNGRERGWIYSNPIYLVQGGLV